MERYYYGNSCPASRLFDKAKAQPTPEAPTKNTSDLGCSPTSYDEETIPKDAKVSYHNFIGAMVELFSSFMII